jgi:hypothetical protein
MTLICLFERPFSDDPRATASHRRQGRDQASHGDICAGSHLVGANFITEERNDTSFSGVDSEKTFGHAEEGND